MMKVTAIVFTLALTASVGALSFAADRSVARRFVTVPVNSGSFGTWSILTRDAIGRHIPRYLSSVCEGESGTGTISSPAFKITVPRIRLSLRGWDGQRGDHNANRIELVEESTGNALRTVRPPLSDAAANVEMDVAEFAGREVCLRLIDGDASNGYAWFGVHEIDAGDAFRADFSKDATLAGWRGPVAKASVEEHFGVPFLTSGKSAAVVGQAVQVPVGLRANRLLLLGMSVPDFGTHWIGDKLGAIRVTYADGAADSYPLIHGESLWWGRKFHTYPEPFVSFPKARKAFTGSIRLYPQGPVEDGAYIACIPTRADTVKLVEFVSDGDAAGAPVILGLTAELAADEQAAGFESRRAENLPKDLDTFLASHPLRVAGKSDAEAKERVNALRNVFYRTSENLPKQFTVALPIGYKGPEIRLRGDSIADLMTNVFLYNVADMAKKVDAEGVYHTSTDGAAWYGYDGFGGFTLDNGRESRTHAGFYYDEAWTRDLGRSLSELIALGYTDKARLCADWCLKMSKVWADDANLKLNGAALPPHICRILQMPGTSVGFGCFENDGHGLTTLMLYHLWRRLPDRDAWLRARWKDIEALGDWPGWQLANKDISRATDVLWSDSEGSGWDGTTGSSVYCDLAQIEALYGLSAMAKSIGQNETAERWSKTADSLRAAGEKAYLETDPRYGKTWTTQKAGWGLASTLGPIILPTDLHGFDYASNYPEWRAYNEAAYLRVRDGFGLNAMGYGQGFIIESSLLLDRMEEASKFIQMTAEAIYNPTHRPYIVPENVFLSADRTTSGRLGDLGNGVQQAEIVKSVRLMAGIDDCAITKLIIMPRLPIGWTGISVQHMPVQLEVNGKPLAAKISYSLARKTDGLAISVSSTEPLPQCVLRLGAFGPIENTPRVLVNGKPHPATVTKSGDSWWVSLVIEKGAIQFSVRVGGLART